MLKLLWTATSIAIFIIVILALNITTNTNTYWENKAKSPLEIKTICYPQEEPKEIKSIFDCPALGRE